MIEELKQPAIDFFLYSYFGIIEEDNEDVMIQKCAERAYLDLCRTLEYEEKGSHESFRDAVCGVVQEQVHVLLDSNINNFDEKHKSACKKIQETADKWKEKLYYGQAQKWLNMTMKYMWLLGAWDYKFKPLQSVVHIPVDRFIMQAVAELGIKLPDKEGGLSSYSKAKPWSKWGEQDYENFRKQIEGKIGDSPYEWEGPAWIKVAKERKEKA